MYLGKDFIKGIKDLKKINMGRIKKEGKDMLEKYKRLKLSYFGRTALCKMKIIPKFNFMFRMIPIKFLEKELKELQQIIN